MTRRCSGIEAATIPFWVVGLVAAAVLLGAASEDQKPARSVWRRVRIEGHGAVLLPAPGDWRAGASQAAAGGPPTLVLLPPAGAPPSFRITVMIAPWNTPDGRTTEDVSQLCDGLKKIRRDDATATRRDNPVREIAGDSLKGCYVSGLLPGADEGAFRYKTQGAGVLDEFVVNFTALSVGADEPAASAMLEMVRAARREPGGHGGPVRVALHGHGSLTLQVPQDWERDVTYPAGDLPPTISLDPPAGGAFSVRIAPTWRELKAPPFSLANVLKLVEKKHGQTVRSARDQPIQQFAGGLAQGYYVSGTDKRGKGSPGRWLYITEGAALLDDLLVNFTVLSNDPNQPEAAATLAILESAKRERGADGSKVREGTEALQGAHRP